MISAQVNLDARALALDRGALAYLTKPINDQILLQYLNLALAAPPG
jgi:DNA-binding response OmpR family regulator